MVKDIDIVKNEIIYQVEDASEKCKAAIKELDSYWDQLKVLVAVSWKTWAKFAAVALVAFILGGIAF